MLLEHARDCWWLEHTEDGLAETIVSIEYSSVCSRAAPQEVLVEDNHDFGLFESEKKHNLVQSIDRGLDPFGSRIKQAIYFKILMENHEGSSGETPILNPDALQATIRETCGDDSYLIEKSIISEITKAFHLSHQQGRNIGSAIDAAKAHLGL